jgi:hypothetical protein
MMPVDFAPCRSVVLDDLVGRHAQSRVLHRELGQLPVVIGIHDRPAGGGGGFVELGLAGALERFLRGARALHELRDGLPDAARCEIFRLRCHDHEVGAGRLHLFDGKILHRASGKVLDFNR